MMYQKFGQLMGESARLWKAKLNQRLKPLGLSYAKWSTLLLIDRLGSNLLLNEIAEALSIEHPTLTRVLKELERDDWIIRHLTQMTQEQKQSLYPRMEKRKWQILKLS